MLAILNSRNASRLNRRGNNRPVTLKAQVNKTDRNGARGIAQMMRVNLYRPAQVKTLASQKHRALLRSFCRKRLLRSEATSAACCATLASR